MEAVTAEATETGYARAAARRREVVAGPDTHIDVIAVPPGSELGLEVHGDEDETLVVIAGTGQAELDGQRLPVRVGSVLYIPRGTPHNLHNDAASDLRLYAVHAATV